MFEAIGKGCSGRDTFTISAWATNSAGANLSMQYAVANFNADELIAVTLSDAYD